jgi:hypothetical protein
VFDYILLTFYNSIQHNGDVSPERQNACLQGIGETPNTRQEHLSPNSLSSENLEVLPEKVGTLGLRGVRRNRCGVAKKQARKAKTAEALAGDIGGGQPGPFRSGQLQALQEPGTSGAQIKGKEKVKKPGPNTVGPAPAESKGPSQGPSKRQGLSEGTPEGRQAKRLRKIGQPSYARAAREGIWMAIVYDGYPRIQVSRENFVSTQRATCGLVDELPEEGFTPQAHRYVLDKRSCRCAMPRRRNQGLADQESTNLNSFGGL